MILPAPKHGIARGENRCVSSDRGVAARLAADYRDVFTLDTFRRAGYEQSTLAVIMHSH
jgi:hypothetical protein